MTSPLIEPAELAALLQTTPDDLVLVDVRWQLGGPSQHDAYLAGHLPGARFVELDADLAAAPGVGGRHPLPEPAALQAAMRRIGVRQDSLVVAYDAATSLSAARLWWLLTDAGVSCRVLNGGLAGWQAEGRAVEGGPVRAEVGDAVLQPGRRTRVDAEQIAAGLDGRPLVDVRSPERFRGDSEPVDTVAGHIPGAVNLPAAGNQHADGRFRTPAEIAERFAGLETPVFSCGSGITAAQSLLAVESAGGTGSIYPGSWSDWITDPSRPVATGDEPTVG